MLFFTLANPNERREGLGTDEDGVLRWKGISVIDLFDVAVVIVSDKKDIDRE